MSGTVGYLESPDAEGLRLDEPLFDRQWRAACCVQEATRGELDWIIREHYLGKWPGVVVLRLGMYYETDLIGAVIFALPPRETSVRYGGATWELARLWIADTAPRNAESWLISQAVKHVRRNHPDVDYLVSYADPSAGHSGTIYRASNWVEDGRTDQERKTPRFDYCYNGKKYSRRSHLPPGVTPERIPRVSKFRYVYALKRRR